MEMLNKLYKIGAILGLTHFIIFISIAIKHFILGSTVFTMLLPFCIASILYSYFSFDVMRKDKSYRYRNHIILSPKSVLITLLLNIGMSLLIV